MDSELRDPWLVAAWPGMGNVASIAAGYLAQAVEAVQVAEIDPAPYFDQRSIRVVDGIAQSPRGPRSLLFAVKNPGEGRDLLIFIGEKQPESEAHAFCDELLDLAREHGVTRVVTFAAIATPIRPEASPRAFAVATAEPLLAELKEHDVQPMREGEISGLNGMLLAVAAERGIEGLCLLGEFPFFASSVANPKGSLAILRRFCPLAGVELDLGPLEQQAGQVEQGLRQHLEQLEAAAQSRLEAPFGPVEAQQEEPEAGLDPEVEARIERLFQEAAQDRAKALELKSELDRHGLFKEYEDRFLNLFRQAD